MLNILFDHEIFTKQRFGGVSRYFYELISSLSKNDNLDLDLFLGINNSGYNFEELNLKEHITQYNLKYSSNLHILFNYLNKFWFDKYVSKKKYDILHKTYYSDIGLELKSKIITTIHDMTHEIYPEFFIKKDSTTILKKKCTENSDAIICVSETTRNDLIELFNVDPERIKVIYHGINLKNNDKSVKYYEKPYILYVGQRWGYKNFNTLLSAYQSDSFLNNNYLLVCFGGGKFNLSEKLFINKYGLQNKVLQIVGNDDLLVSLYKYAEVFVYTSFYEGFGFPPLEAMECGCPVVTSPGGSIKEILDDSAVFFDPNRGEDLLNKINMLLNDIDYRNQLIHNGRNRVKLFTWEKSVSEHLKFYNDI